MTTDKQREAFEIAATSGDYACDAISFARRNGEYEQALTRVQFKYFCKGWQAALASQSARIEELETICAEAYQVVGMLSDFLPDAKLLDNLSQQKLVHTDVLPCTVTYTEMPVQSPEVQKLVEAAKTAVYHWERDASSVFFEDAMNNLSVMLPKMRADDRHPITQPHVTVEEVVKILWSVDDECRGFTIQQRLEWQAQALKAAHPHLFKE